MDWAEIETIGKCMFVIYHALACLLFSDWPFSILFFSRVTLYHTLRQIGRHLSGVRLPGGRLF